MRFTPVTAAAGGVTDASATFRGTTTVNGAVVPVFDLNIPSLSIAAPNLRGDGIAVDLANGNRVSAAAITLNYTLLGVWSVVQPGAGSYHGFSVSGPGTALASVPTVGSATYTGNGKVVGAYHVPTGTGLIQSGALLGNASVTTNFATNTFTGTLSNMQAFSGGGSTPWNNVTLSGSISRGGIASFGGGTSTSGAPAGAGVAGFSSAATGAISGTFYGPSYEEIGANWSLYESTGDGGKAAIGMFGAAR